MRMNVLWSGLTAATLLAAGCRSNHPADDAATSRPTTTSATAPSSRPSRPAKPPLEHVRRAFDREDLERGWFSHAAYGPMHDGVIIAKPEDDFPYRGKWKSETIVPAFAFTELLPSWNVSLPSGDQTGVRFEVRVRDAASGAWSPWLYMGYWGRVLRDRRTISFDGGKVETDILELTRPADAYEVQATLYNFSTGHQSIDPTPSLKRLSVVTSRVAPAGAEPTSKPSWSPIDLPVPFRAQGDESESIRHSVCSPTSVSMVLEWAGTKRETAQNCVAIWDDDYAMFGNWNRAVQLAGSLGHEAYLERVSSMDEARALINSGQPIIASIRFKAGAFPSNVQKSTAGHLIVLRGIDANGDIICNDPASRARGNGIVYNAEELGRAWIGSTGGVTYVIKKLE